MPAPTADAIDQANLADLVRRHKLNHLLVRRHGATLVLYERIDEENVNRARFTAISRTRWRLDMPVHTGRWQPTPYVGTLVETFQMLIGDLAPLMVSLA